MLVSLRHDAPKEALRFRMHEAVVVLEVCFWNGESDRPFFHHGKAAWIRISHDGGGGKLQETYFEKTFRKKNSVLGPSE